MRALMIILAVGSLIGGCASGAGPTPSADGSPMSSASAAPSASTMTAPASALEREGVRVIELLGAGSDVYDVPDPLPPDDRGRLMKIEPIHESEEGRVYRVLYHSRQADGETDVAVTGSIWIPAIPAPYGGFPILAWGPGANGRGDECASSRRALDDSENASTLVDFVHQGYVVASTDYVGHGTRFPEVIAPETGVYALLDAARAALDLLGPDASNRVVAGGHSLGADSAKVLEVHGPAYADGLDVRGILALEGGTDHRRYVENTFSLKLAPWGVFDGALHYALAYPELRIEDVLLADKIADVSRTDEAACVFWEEVFGPQPLDEVFAANPLDLPDWAARIDAEAPTQATYPLFLAIAPTSDWHVAGLLEVADRLCLDAPHIEAHVYPDTDHNTSIAAARQDYMKWLENRFHDRPAPGNCGEVR